MRTKLGVVFSFTIVSALLMWLTFDGFSDNMQYYMSIHDLNAMGQQSYGKGLRVKGELVSGSLVQSQQSLQVSFRIAENGEELAVRYDKELPDTFKDGSQVLVEGKMHPEGYFQARTLMAKCASKYESHDNYNAKNYDPEMHRAVKNETYGTY